MANSKSDCQEVLEDLYLYVDMTYWEGPASAGEAYPEIAQHLRECEACDDEAVELLRMLVEAHED